MIQRKQTLWLLGAFLLTGLMLILPLARLLIPDDEFVLYAFGMRSAAGEAVVGTPWLGLLLTLATLVPLATVFLYRRLLVQVRLCIVAMILQGGSLLMLAYTLYRACRGVAGATAGDEYLVSYSLTDLFPALAIVCSAMALRGVVRDRNLLRSLDRIR